MDRDTLTDSDMSNFYDPNPSKWERMIIKIRSIFIEGNQWHANKKAWNERIFDDGTFTLPFNKLSKGEISLCCKHLEALKEIARTEHGYGIVFEDDVILMDNFAEKFRRCMAEMPGEWDIIFIGSAFGHRPPERRAGKRVYQMKPPRGKCSDSYVVTSTAAKILLSKLTPFTLPIDWELMYWMNELSLDCFWWDPPLVTQGSQTGKFNSSLRDNPPKHVIAMTEASSGESGKGSAHAT
jgi:GR25 family glycosyltransferase involved in LPS biosynthesis